MRIGFLLTGLLLFVGCSVYPVSLPTEYHQNGSLHSRDFHLTEHFDQSSHEVWVLFFPVKTAKRFGNMVNEVVVERSADGAVNVESYSVFYWLLPPIVWIYANEVQGDLVRFGKPVAPAGGGPGAGP